MDKPETVDLIAMGLQALLPFLTKAIELKKQGVEVPGYAEVTAAIEELKALPDLPER